MEQIMHFTAEFEIPEEKKITSLQMHDDTIFTVNPESEWMIDKVFTDYTRYGERHKVLVVTFKLKEEVEE